MKYLAVLPWVYKPYYDACRATMHPDLVANTLFIDNSQKNLGIMRSHNIGAQRVLDEGLDWLIILSAAIRFLEPGGMDYVQVLADNMDHYVIHGATPNHPPAPDQTKVDNQEQPEYRNGVFGWHLTAFKRELFENVGIWDENFTPYGYDDIDLSIRIQAHYKGRPGWGTFPVEVSDTTMSHSINLGGVKSQDETKIEYFHRKWGRYHGEWQVPSYPTPFNEPQRSLGYWPKQGEEHANNEAWEHLNANQ